MIAREHRITACLGALLLLLVVVTARLGIGIARTSDLFLGPYTYHLFLVLNLAIVGCVTAVGWRVARQLKSRGQLGRALVFGLYLVVVVVVVLDAVLEFCPRLIPPRVLAALPYGGNYLYPHGTRTHEYRKDLGYRPRPHVRVEYFYTNDLVSCGQISPTYDHWADPISFATDGLGFRNEDEATTADIIVLGDSFTELPYMAYEQIWPNVLARQTGWRVRNLAVTGYGPLQQTEVLRQWGLGFRPQLVLLGFYEGNDILECDEFDRFRRSGLSYPVWLVRRYAGRMGWFHRRPVVAIAGLLALPYRRIAEAWSGERSRAGRHYFNPIEFKVGGQRQKIGLLSINLKTLSADSGHVRSQRGWPLCAETLREMKRLCDAAGAMLAVVYIPTKERVYLPLLRGAFTAEAVHGFVALYHPEMAPVRPDEFEAALFANMDETEAMVGEFCRAEGLGYLDLTGPFRRAAQAGRMIYFPFDTHWNGEGNWIAAEEIAHFLGGFAWEKAAERSGGPPGAQTGPRRP